jgi:hypothetical protein
MRAAGEHVAVIEQPFPVAFKSDLKQNGPQAADAQLWQDVKAECGSAGVDIYADESVCTAEDVALLAPYVHGVNVKMDKAGGFRGAVCALHAAKQLGLKTWVGMMVGSKLASTAASHLLPLAVAADLDGAPLVTEQSQALFQVHALHGASACNCVTTFPGGVQVVALWQGRAHHGPRHWRQPQLII